VTHQIDRRTGSLPEFRLDNILRAVHPQSVERCIFVYDVAAPVTRILFTVERHLQFPDGVTRLHLRHAELSAFTSVHLFAAFLESYGNQPVAVRFQVIENHLVTAFTQNLGIGLRV